jgi:DNA-binding transcriptional LysR family regulator
MPDLPPLAALRAFEAAARLGGFARAAAELNVSTSAVSHQIRALEAKLGTRLLDRTTGAGGVQVTAAGRGLLGATQEALRLLGEACAEVRGATGRQRLTVSANLPFSAMWLARRLAEFSARHPEAAINAIVQDAEPDFARHGIDLAIVNVSKTALRQDDDVLVREAVFPVCSPELLDFASNHVCRCRLLQEAHDNSPEIDWRTWAPHFQMPSDFESKIVRFSSFSQVVGAAIGGAGVALGRSPLIDPELESGRLVRVFPDLEVRASWCFALRFPPAGASAQRRTRMLDALLTFLRREANDRVSATSPTENLDPIAWQEPSTRS